MQGSRYHSLGTLLLFVLVAFMGLSGCGLPIIGTPLPTETLGEGPISSYQDSKPSLTVIARAAEVADVESLFQPLYHSDTLSQLRAVDYNTYFVIIGFQGLKGHGGYSVQIQHVTRTDSEVYVYAQFSEPPPGQGLVEVETSPYHAVKVLKQDRWGREVTFNLVLSGSVVASVLHYIP